VQSLQISVFKLSEQSDVVPGPPKDLEWTIFTSLGTVIFLPQYVKPSCRTSDPEPLRQLANSSRTTRAEQNQPRPFQASPLSNLQRFVKIARKSIVDPVLEGFSCESSESEDKRVDIVEETSRSTSPPLTSITKNKKPKSETYKMAWSLSVQHLLERLLEEIPKSEKHRYDQAFMYNIRAHFLTAL
jgi:hypothetical protein